MKLFRQGYALIEIITGITIFSLIFGVLISLIVLGYHIQNYAWQQSLAIGEARRGIETMVNEIRKASLGEDGSYIIEKAEDYQFIFYSDINNDGKTERVRYFVDEKIFKKGVIEPSDWPIKYPIKNEQIYILSQYVQNQPPIFRYYDSQGVELPAPARLKDTKLMKVYLVINVDPNRPPNDFELESSVQLRNLKEE